jgi:hypothetical protein
MQTNSFKEYIDDFEKNEPKKTSLKEAVKSTLEEKRAFYQKEKRNFAATLEREESAVIGILCEYGKKKENKLFYNQTSDRFEFKKNTATCPPGLRPTFKKKSLWSEIKARRPDYFNLLQKKEILDAIINRIDQNLQLVENKFDQFFGEFIKTLREFDGKVLGDSRDLNPPSEVKNLPTVKQFIRNKIELFLRNPQQVRRGRLNIALLGPAGSGKTTVAEQYGKIFSAMGILALGDFKVKSRPDLVAGFKGQTAPKTKSLLESMKESVLFIDEAYALTCQAPPIPGETPKFDSYGQEAMNVMTRYLADNRGKIMVIAAGYEDDMKQCWLSFPAMNQLFETITLPNFNGDELFNIFKFKQGKTNILNQKADQCFRGILDKSKDRFVNQAGDIENLTAKLRNIHSLKKRPLTVDEMKMGVRDYLLQKELAKLNVRMEKNPTLREIITDKLKIVESVDECGKEPKEDMLTKELDDTLYDELVNYLKYYAFTLV